MHPKGPRVCEEGGEFLVSEETPVLGASPKVSGMVFSPREEELRSYTPHLWMGQQYRFPSLPTFQFVTFSFSDFGGGGGRVAVNLLTVAALSIPPRHPCPGEGIGGRHEA